MISKASMVTYETGFKRPSAFYGFQGRALKDNVVIRA